MSTSNLWFLTLAAAQCDLSIFGDRFHEPPPPKPKPTGTFDWAKSSAGGRRAREGARAVTIQDGDTEAAAFWLRNVGFTKLSVAVY